MIRFIGLLTCLCWLSCTNNVSEVDQLTEQKQSFNIERGNGITILYSDSAIVKVRISADSIVRHINSSEAKDVFPRGIFVEFLSPNGSAVSWLTADRAVRNEKENTVTAMGNVRFYNHKNEQLISTELIWNEDQSILSTDKFVSIVQPEKGDTTYGFGFQANEEFNIFEIKKRTSAIFRPDSFDPKKN